MNGKTSRIGRLLVMALLAISTSVGCQKHVSAPVPGQLNTFDAYAYRVLADAQAAINSFKSSVTSGQVAETPTLKMALNQAITDYDASIALYKAWHAAGGTGDTAPIAGALTKVNSDVTNINLAGGK